MALTFGTYGTADPEAASLPKPTFGTMDIPALHSKGCRKAGRAVRGEEMDKTPSPSQAEESGVTIGQLPPKARRSAENGERKNEAAPLRRRR
jgi:hypothetical protein